MKNYGLLKFRNVDVDNFTTKTGMNIRKKINPILRKVFKLATKSEIIVDNYPDLDKNKPYIFISIHSFVEDATANLATIDRNAYLLFGTSDQLEVNKDMYVGWANGFIYVDRKNKQSRNDALLKMEKVLENGNSVLIYAEGGFNNTENLLCQRLFSSPYILSTVSKAEVVPVAPFHEFGTDKIYMNIGDPIKLYEFDDKNAALDHLRDVLSTMAYNNIEKHSKLVSRKDLGKNHRLDFMEERRQEYLNTKWTKDVWDEELVQYFNKEEREYNDLQKSYDKLKLTKENANIVAPILKKRKEEKKYDFKEYMHRNWNR